MGILQERDDNPEAYWVRYIKNRIKNKKNFLGCLTGSTGSGKSWSGLSLCYQVDETFNKERIVFSMKELMALINEGNLKNGSAIMWDESGIDVSHRSWQSTVNKLINFLLQTFRHKRLILIFTVPYLDFLDASTRKLFHAELLTQSINYDKKTTKIKPQLLQYNSRSRKFYYKYLRIKTKYGVAPVKAWHIIQPPIWLIESYEIKKEAFTSALNKDIEFQLDEIEKKRKGNKKELTELQEKALKLMAKYKNVQMVAVEMGCIDKNVYVHLSRARKKGWKPEDMLEKEEMPSEKDKPASIEL